MMNSICNSQPSEVMLNDNGAVEREIWSLPVDQAILEPFLRELFTDHWRGIRLVPLIEGTAYGWKCPSAPESVRVNDGCMTIKFADGGCFQLTVGESFGSESQPVSEVYRQQCKPHTAQLFRSFGKDGKPLSWGFEMWNGAGHSVISVCFPSPFLDEDDSPAQRPVFSRLATWRAISQKWLNRPPEALDEEGRGFCC